MPVKILLVLCLLNIQWSTAQQNTPCDCCNYYLFLQQPDLDLIKNSSSGVFDPQSIRKTKIRSALVEVIDSTGATTEILSKVTFNKRGYVVKRTDYYQGIPSTESRFKRGFKQRITYTENYGIDSLGRPLPDSMDYYHPVETYSYKRRSVRIEQQLSTKMMVPDELVSFQTKTWDKHKRLVELTNYVPRLNYGEVIPINYTTKINYTNDGLNAAINYYQNDTLLNTAALWFNTYGKITKQLYSDILNAEILLGVIGFEYDENQHLTRMKSTNLGGLYTECSDRGDYEILYRYENGLFQSATYSYEDAVYPIKISYSNKHTTRP